MPERPPKRLIKLFKGRLSGEYVKVWPIRSVGSTHRVLNELNLAVLSFEIRETKARSSYARDLAVYFSHLHADRCYIS